MKVIYKYIIPASSEFSLMLPDTAEVLSCQVQNKEPHLWILLDPDAPKIIRKFIVVPTGVPIKDSDFFMRLKFINTVQLEDGALVFHVFEKFSD